jgi:hypothetical protein
MTLALLDPCLFDPAVHPDGIVGVVAGLDEVLSICRRRGILIPMVEEYWDKLSSRWMRPAERATPPRRRGPFQQLRRTAQQLDLPTYLEGTKVWGFRHLFEDLGEPEDRWADWLAESAVRCCLGGQDVVVFVASVEGRNFAVECHDGTALRHHTRWRVHTQPRGVGPCHLPCWHHRRNVELDWTTRFDPRLPAAADGARFPFCPPSDWASMGVSVWRSVEARPSFVDAHGHGWARPRINDGAGHHWDVYLSDERTRRRLGGVPRLNITAWGSLSDRGDGPGSIHHEGDQAGRIRRDAAGWRCPH